MMGEVYRLINKEAEKEVISGCLFNAYVFEYVQDYLNRDLFTDYECQKTYDVMMQLVSEGKQPDAVEVAARLMKENIDITQFMLPSVTTSELTKQRIEYLENLSIRRRLQGLCYKGQVMAGDPSVDISDFHLLQKEIEQVFSHVKGDEVGAFGSVVASLVNNVADRKNGTAEIGMMTGLHIFDARYGFHTGDLVVIAGETSQGKSTLATTIAFNMAKEGIPSAYYSMEMSNNQLVARIMGKPTRIEPRMLLYGRLSDSEYQRVYDTSLEMKGLPIYFDERNKTTFPRVCGSIKRLVKTKGVRAVFIDYLQILANGSVENREQVIGDMARDLKRLASDNDVCIVALSQMSRPPKGVKGDPSINRMRGSGQIEEACDMCVLVQRTGAETAKLNIAKGRNIGLATETVRFNASLSYFCDFEQGDPDAPYQEKKELLPF